MWTWINPGQQKTKIDGFDGDADWLLQLLRDVGGVGSVQRKLENFDLLIWKPMKERQPF